MADETPHYDWMDKLEIDVEELAEDLTGRGDGLRKSKPTKADGLTQYVWRMARFHAGYDTCMPVTCTFWLDSYLEDEGIDAGLSGVLEDKDKALKAALGEIVDQVLLELGESLTGAAERWEGILY